jgi:hypothetical protein
MKRVRTLAGAIGLAPLAIGAAVAPAAPKAAAAPAGAGNSKTVALSHRACAGSVYAGTGNTNSRMHFWYTGEGNGLTCIGTVVYSEWVTGLASQQMRLRIWVSGGALDYSGFFNGRHITISGDPTGGNVFSHAVRLDYGAGNVEVCVAQVSRADHDKLTAGPLCRTVP